MDYYIDITELVSLTIFLDEFQLTLEEYQEIDFAPIILGQKKTELYPPKVKNSGWDPPSPYKYRHYLIVSFACQFKDKLMKSYESFLDAPDFDSMLIKKITDKIKHFEPYTSLS